MRLHYRESGLQDAPAVVLLHGLFGDKDNLGGLARQLADHYRVVALDLPNHGHSPWHEDVSWPSQQAQLQQTLDALAITQCHLIGHSLGGILSFQAATKRPDLARGVPDCLALWVATAGAPLEDAQWLAAAFPGRCWIVFERHLQPDDSERLARLRALSAASSLPLVACGDVHMHVRGRRALQDVLTALRLNTAVDRAGHTLFANGERHLRKRLRLARLFFGARFRRRFRTGDAVTQF